MTKLSFVNIEDRTDDIVDDVMRLPEVQGEDAFKLRLIVEEVVSNIVFHAYPKGEDGGMTICAERDDEGVTLVFTDCVISFNPLEKPDPDISLSAEERPIGGLGIFLLKQMAREVEYVRSGNSNILTVKV